MNVHGSLNSLLVHDCLLASLLVLPLVRILRYSEKQASKLAHDCLKLELFLQEARYIATYEFFFFWKLNIVLLMIWKYLK